MDGECLFILNIYIYYIRSHTKTLEIPIELDKMQTEILADQIKQNENGKKGTQKTTQPGERSQMILMQSYKDRKCNNSNRNNNKCL